MNLSFLTPAIPPETSPVEAIIFLIPSSTPNPPLRRPRTTSRIIISSSGVTVKIAIHAIGPNGSPMLWKNSDTGMNSWTMDSMKFE